MYKDNNSSINPSSLQENQSTSNSLINFDIDLKKYTDEMKDKIPSSKIEDTKKILENFRTGINSNFSKFYISYEGSTLLLVLLSLKGEDVKCRLLDLPEEDREIIKSATTNASVNIESFSVYLNKYKDFILYFESLKSGYDRKEFMFINTVVNPRPQDLQNTNQIGQSVKLSDEDNKIEIGHGLSVDKQLVKKVINWNKEEYGSSNEQFYQNQEKELSETQIINTKNKNAYEIRTDVLAMALDWAKWSHNQYLSALDKSNSDMGLKPFTHQDVIEIAKKFYSFVECKKY